MRLRFLAAIVLFFPFGLRLEIVSQSIAIEPSTTTVKQFEETPLSENDRDHWSFQPIRQPSLPSVQHVDWPTNGIDYFILSDLEAAKLTPTHQADRSTLLRRLKLDLLGLPPTLEEMEAFSSDRSSNAYENVVDQFLSSPRYGERWGQYWLDLARFAETDGFEHDRVRKEAWRYRDWVIQALNGDLPYDQFLFQQLAGDQDPDQRQHIATMFCLAGPDMPDINEQDLRRHDRLNELTSTIGASLLGLQFHCAQCHDHKYDPISQADFYRLRAIFETSVPELERDQPFNSFTSVVSTIEPRFYFRGELGQPGPVIRAGLPRIAVRTSDKIPYCSSDSPRSEFARWLFEPEQPLTARVIVNRIWQSHFGRGLFESASDVGVVAASPTHPDLLDWLAIELRRHNWSLKDIHRLIVLSSTYRQQSYAAADDSSWSSGLEIDPRNRLYGRFPRHRMEAEIIRDSMLAASGLLNFEAGGDGVMPPLPEELIGTLLKGQWKTSDNTADHWRRSIYIFARRNLRYPIFESFDRPDANASCSKRDLSTSAIQALQMMNSQLSVECGDHLRDRITGLGSFALTQADSNQPPDIEPAIDRLFRYALSRKPTRHELKKFVEFIDESTSNRDAKLLAACLALFNTSEFVYIE